MDLANSGGVSDHLCTDFLKIGGGGIGTPGSAGPDIQFPKHGTETVSTTIRGLDTISLSVQILPILFLESNKEAWG